MTKKHWAMIAIMAVGSINGLGADNVPPVYRMIAQEQGVPAHVFYAMALTESGQSSLSQHQLRPWPWTLNVDGQGQYFPSRKAAWLALRHALDSEEHSVDIGLMQINWRYHQQALGSAWQALDPYHNLRVGAAILRRCYASEADWWESVGCYHSPSDIKKARKYRERVKGYWQQLTEKNRS